MTRVCDGRSLPRGDANAVYLLRPFGRLAHEIWNVADPANPKLVVRIGGDYKDTHKSWWECDTGIAFLVSGVPGWRAQRMLEIYDLGDPSRPVKIRDFGLPGHEPGATGAVPSDLHGPISTGPQGNRLYLAYGPLNGGIFQIIDREKLLQGPKEATPANLRYPEVGRLDMSPLHGAHTSFPTAADAAGRIRKVEGRGGARFRHDRQRGDRPGQRLPGDAPDGVVRRHQRRGKAHDGF